MSQQFSGEDLEGRLSAQRRVLQWLLRTVEADEEQLERLLAVLEEPFPPADHQEDPGAVPTEAFASQTAYVAECRLLLGSVRERLPQGRDVPFAEG